MQKKLSTIIFSYIMVFSLGVILCAGAVYYFAIRPSQNTIRDYQEQQRILTDANKSLGESIISRDSDIKRLEGVASSLRSEADRARRDYLILERANGDRQKIIIEARRSVESTDDAIRKLELIIDAFEQIEQMVNH